MNSASANTGKWKTSNTIVSVLLLVNIIALILWLVVFYHRYENIARVVTGVWTAITAVLAYLKIKSRAITLADFLSLPPARAMVITVTLLNLLAIYLFVLWHFPVHTLTVTTSIAGQRAPDALIYWNGAEKGRANAAGELAFRVPGGSHDLSARLAGYGERKAQKIFVWLKRNYQVDLRFIAADQQSGFFYLETRPNNVRIRLIDARGAGIPGKDSLELATPYLTDLPAGEYRLILSSPGYADYTSAIRIFPTDTVRIKTVLKQGVGNLRIVSELTDAEIYLNDEKQAKTTPAMLTSLAPGIHIIRLVKKDEEVTSYQHVARKEVRIKAGQTTTLIFKNSDFKTQESN